MKKTGKGKRLDDWTIEDFLALHRFVKSRPDKPSKWKGIEKARVEMARLHGKDEPYDAKTIRTALERYPTPPPPKAKRVQPKWVSKYEETDLHRKLLEDYPHPSDPKKLNHQGMKYDTVGQDLYLHFKESDPTTLPLESFKEAFDWDIYVDEEYLKKHKQRQTRYDKATALRNIMVYAGFDPKAYKWTSTKGLKRPPKRIYLEETQLVRYIYGIEEPDTLVLSRLGFEGGGRFSATSEIKTENIMFDLNQITLVETKTDTYPIKPFRPCTMNFVRKYIQDFDIKSKLFALDYEEYERRFLKAGLRAGLWRYQKDAQGNILYEEKFKRIKGKTIKYKSPIVEGKKTTSHLMKHTFVSLGSLHGLSLETCADITATDIGTLQKWYMGTGRKKTLAEIHGEVQYVPWWEWIDTIMDKHWVKRYEELMKIRESSKVDNIKPKAEEPPKAKAPRKKTPFSWDRIQAIVRSQPKTVKGKRLKEYWSIIWKIKTDNPELTYSEIKEKYARQIREELKGRGF